MGAKEFDMANLARVYLPVSLEVGPSDDDNVSLVGLVRN